MRKTKEKAWAYSGAGKKKATFLMADEIMEDA